MSNPANSQMPHVINCDGGLSNRLNEVLFALILRDKFGGAWELVWPRTNWCRASFGSLFSIDMPVLESPSHFIGHEGEYRKLIHENFGQFPLDQVIFHSQLTCYEDYERVLAGDRPIYYCHHLIPPFATVSDLKAALGHLKVNATLYARALEFCNVHQVDDTVLGLHIRKTDFGSRVNDEDLFRLASGGGKRFFVCSDDAEVNQRFAALPNCVVFPKTSFPEKLAVDGDWHAAMVDKQGKILAYNINRSEESLVEALIDLLILSRTTLVDTSHSTFLRMAMIFNATNYFESCAAFS